MYTPERRVKVRHSHAREARQSAAFARPRGVSKCGIRTPERRVKVLNLNGKGGLVVNVIAVIQLSQSGSVWTLEIRPNAINEAM
jgi:hypothetical protein